MTHDELQQSAAAYALGALDAGEREAFEAHLEACEGCRTEVDAYEEASALLAYAAPVARPRDGRALRERIVANATSVRPITSARPRSSSGMAWIAAAAAMIVAAISGNAYRQQRLATDRLGAELSAAQRDLATRDSMVAAFLGPEVHVVSLSAPERKPSMRVFWNHTRNVFIVTAHDLPPAPSGKTYQLWAMPKGKAPMSMGTFTTDANGRATAVLAVDATVNAAGFIDECGLTIEPAGGSPQPTETPRLVGVWRHVD
jgi:anti-sigma-K factor RskA